MFIDSKFQRKLLIDKGVVRFIGKVSKKIISLKVFKKIISIWLKELTCKKSGFLGFLSWRYKWNVRFVKK